MEEWKIAERLGCPNLRFHNSKWYALNKDPCPTCKHETCNNRGKPNKDPERLIVIKKARGKGK